METQAASRKEYFHKYYLANRERKLAAVKARYRGLKAQKREEPSVVERATPQESSYFEEVKKDCVRMYGEQRGPRLAERLWEIRGLTDPRHEEEKIRISYGLA